MSCRPPLSRPPFQIGFNRKINFRLNYVPDQLNTPHVRMRGNPGEIGLFERDFHLPEIRQIIFS